LIANEVVAEAWKNTLIDINKDIFSYSMVKPLPSEWAEKTLIIPDNVSRYSGKFSYDLTPYWREPINHLHETSPVRYVSILKSAQNGCTQSVVVPAMLYTMAIDPNNMAFTAGNLLLAKKTIEERIDTILRSSKLDHLIRPHAVKKGNQRTGDTAQSKEFPGGTLTIGATGSADFFRYWSAKLGLIDDFDTAPVNLGGEGSVRSLIEGRQNSFGDSAKTFFISTPTDTNTSQIWQQYQLGTQKKWNWPCWNCSAYMPMDWKIVLEDNSLAGIIWRTDGKGRLINESVAFRCPHCGEVTQEKDKYELNQNGTWISTVEEPLEDLHESYSTNAITQPPGFTGWVKLVQEWLKANPAGQRANISLLIPFNNVRLGLPFEDQGDAPKSTALMQNVRNYHHGTIPDRTSDDDGNGKIVLVTLACDLGGVMDGENQDVRLDWEIVAHAATGVTYSVDQGSIGTFKRTFERKNDKAYDKAERKKFTYAKGMKDPDSVWPYFREILNKIYKSEDGHDFPIDLTVVDTGFFEKHATQFVIDMQEEGYKVYGVKGRTDIKYRPLQRDSAPVRRSVEKPKQLYTVEVNQMKDDLAANMNLQKGEGGSQPSGFMNYPQQNEGKYSYPGYFSHFEGEARKEVKDKSDQVVGFRWDKKHSTVVNHFWDVRIYNLCAVHIYLDLIRREHPQYKNITWEEFVLLVTE
jgi:phage terminase large subunit GpA-like protein